MQDGVMYKPDGNAVIVAAQTSQPSGAAGMPTDF
jgi:hypothetical protein